MSKKEESNMVLLMRTKEKVKELVLLVSDFQKENNELKADISEIRKSFANEREEMKQKIDSLTRQYLEMEKEMNRANSLHQQELHDAHNEILYKSQELDALQHFCESKLAEIATLQQTIATPKPPASPESTESTSQQVAYVESRLQKVQRRLLEVHKTCEQVEGQFTHQHDLLVLYKQNTQWLLQVLAAAITQIPEQAIANDTEPNNDAPSIEAVHHSPTPSPEKLETVEEEFPRLKAQFDAYEKQIAALEKVVQEQTARIEQLKSIQDKPLQLPSFDPTPLFSSAVDTVRSSLNTRINLLEEELALFKKHQTPEPQHSSSSLKRKKSEIPPLSPSNSKKPTESLGETESKEITCCKCYLSFHISCVISEKENVSDLLRKNKHFVCKSCSKG